MSDESLNPYAPPSREEVISSEAMGGTWRVEGDYLVLREGTVLPEVDLDGRGRGGPLTPMVAKFAAPIDVRGFAAIGGCLLAVGIYFLIQSLRGAKTSVLVAMLIAYATLFLLRGVKVRTAPIYLFGYISIPAVRSTMRRARLRKWLTAVLLVPVFLIFPLMIFFSPTVRGGGMSDALKLGMGMFAVSLVLLLCVAVWGTLEKGWACSRVRDGWVWIKGLGPEALAALGARAVGYQPVPLKKKVFKMRLDLMPASFWARTYGTGLIAKIRRSSLRLRTKEGPIEHVAFHWSERTLLSPAEGDSELLEKWRLETAGTPLADWPLAYAERFDSPSGYTQAVQLVFLSPDGKQAAISSVGRSVNDRKLQESPDLNFRSYTASGRIIATATRDPLEFSPPEVDFMVIPGKPMEVAAAHLQRTSGEELISVNADELFRREGLEMELTRKMMETAGIYGPVEEMDFYRP